MNRLMLVKSELPQDNEIDYSEYGFEIMKVLDTPFKAIIRNGEIISFVRDGYKLLPNEIVMNIVEDVANEMKLSPFKTLAVATRNCSIYRTKGNSKRNGIEIISQFGEKEHMIIDRKATRVYAFYTMPEISIRETEIRDKFNVVNFGVFIRNSIDTTNSLSVEAFSFRHICSNVSLFSLSRYIDNAPLAIRIIRKHTRNLNIDTEYLADMIKSVCGKMNYFSNLYKEWIGREITREEIGNIVKSLPRKYIPAYIKIEDKKKFELIGEPPTVWKIYNDITGAIWHTPLNMNTKQILYNNLHDSLILER